MISTSKQSTAALTLLALGIVYGDIGTSPLYAVKETFNPAHGIPLSTANILGGASAIFWALMIVVSLKYVTLVLRANNRGEGGIMALLALASSSVRERAALARAAPGARRVRRGAVLRRRGAHAGDLGALRGRGAGSRHRGLQALRRADRQRRADRAVPHPAPRHRRGGRAVRPGVRALVRRARRGWALEHRAQSRRSSRRSTRCTRSASSPATASASFVVLGAVLLAVTGAEALYADMGHFGKRAIRIAWFWIVAPALVLNYFGQGALLMADPKALENPFFLAFPSWALYPMVALATAATVIASQATISGAYSLTRQAIQLGYLPRMDDPPHLGAHHRPDLRAGGQLGPARRGARGRGRLRLVVEARVGLRRRGDGHDAGDHVPHLLRDPLRLGLSALALPAGHRPLHGRRRRVPVRRAAQGPGGRLVPAGARRRGVLRHDDLAPRPRAAVPAMERRVDAARRAARRPARATARARCPAPPCSSRRCRNSRRLRCCTA